MRVYIIRHGESLNNLKKRWTGWLDVPLTDRGFEDARRARELLKDTAFDRVFASDLRRARETAETAMPGCRYQTSPLLREMNVGSLADQPLSTRTPEISARINESGYKSFGGESHEDILDRVRTFRKELEAMDCGTAAIFTHAGWLRCFLDETVGARLSRSAVLCGNCTVGIFDFTGGKWYLHSWINLG